MGIMGKGIALQFSKAFPQNYSFYRKAFEQNELAIAKVLVFETGTMFNPKYIINFPTKKHWRHKSKMEYITAGLADFSSNLLGREKGWVTERKIIQNSARNFRKLTFLIFILLISYIKLTLY